jgi:WhiB family redox-sensing transcriptional regulator
VIAVCADCGDLREIDAIGLCHTCYPANREAGTTDEFARVASLPSVPAVDLRWQVDALCAEVDTELFFPEKGGSTRAAKSVCRQCDVRAECLDYALETGQRFGIYGGASERERRRLLRLDDADDLEGAA